MWERSNEQGESFPIKKYILSFQLKPLHHDLWVAPGENKCRNKFSSAAAKTWPPPFSRISAVFKYYLYILKCELGLATTFERKGFALKQFLFFYFSNIEEATCWDNLIICYYFNQLIERVNQPLFKCQIPSLYLL